MLLLGSRFHVISSSLLLGLPVSCWGYLLFLPPLCGALGSLPVSCWGYFLFLPVRFGPLGSMLLLLPVLTRPLGSLGGASRLDSPLRRLAFQARLALGKDAPTHLLFPLASKVRASDSASKVLLPSFDVVSSFALQLAIHCRPCLVALTRLKAQ